MTKITAELLIGVPYARLGIPGRARRRKKLPPRAAPVALAPVTPGVYKRAALIGPMPAVKVRGKGVRPGRLATVGEIIASK